MQPFEIIGILCSNWDCHRVKAAQYIKYAKKTVKLLCDPNIECALLKIHIYSWPAEAWIYTELNKTWKAYRYFEVEGIRRGTCVGITRMPTI